MRKNLDGTEERGSEKNVGRKREAAPRAEPVRGAAPRRRNAPCWSATSCSPTDYSAVPSALGGLTSGFGMGPGVPPLPWSLTNKGHSAQGARRRALRAAQRDFDSLEIASLEKEELGREELGRLVPLDSTPRSAYICGLSNS